MDHSSSSNSVSNEEMRRRLLAAAWFLVAYELLKSDIVERTKQFFRRGWDKTGPIVDPRYDSDVRALAKHSFDASLTWLERQGALSAAEVSAVQDVRKYRNRVAHNLFGLLMTPNESIDHAVLGETAILIKKLGRYWARQPLPG